MTGTLRSTAEVGELYDQMQPMSNEIGDGQFHLWYWYDEVDDDASMEEAMRRITRKTGEALGLRPGEHVLDAGCGVGESAFLLAAEAGVRVTGITVSQVQVDDANRRAEANGTSDRVTFRYGDFMDLDFPDGTFDAVFAIEALAYAPDLVAALRELGRVLRPGGRISFADFSLEKPMTPEQVARFTAPLQVNEPLPLADLLAAVREAGLEVEEYTQCGPRVGGRKAVYRRIEEARRPQMIAKFGEELATAVAANTQGFFDAMPEYVGYVIISARKPRP
ncbi:MAG TPA: methyltransferase domain-containing protein [Pseudonocardiaceae bacterium]